MKYVESDFSSQWLSNSLFENLEGYQGQGSQGTPGESGLVSS